MAFPSTSLFIFAHFTHFSGITRIVPTSGSAATAVALATISFQEVGFGHLLPSAPARRQHCRPCRRCQSAFAWGQQGTPTHENKNKTKKEEVKIPSDERAASTAVPS
jgi:hypothetical protein